MEKLEQRFIVLSSPDEKDGNIVRGINLNEERKKWEERRRRASILE